MDVRCAQCGTEYELDDDRLGHEAVTVKCATCGYVFKVRKEDAEQAAAAAPPPDTRSAAGAGAGPGSPRKGQHWMVRQQGGNVLTFKELTTLQKWIVERKVTREDEISKSGETWKRLGSIAELASFFQVVEGSGGPQVSASNNPVVPPPPPVGAYPMPPMVTPGMPPVPQQSLPPGMPAPGMPPVPQGSLPPGGMPPLPPGSLPPPHVQQQTSGSYSPYPYPPGAYPQGMYPPGYPPYPYPPPPLMDPSAYPPGSMPPLPAGSMPPPPQAPPGSSASGLPAQPAPPPPAAVLAPPPNATPALAMPVLDDDDPVLRWQRRRRITVVLALTAAVGGGFLATGLVLYPAQTAALWQQALAMVGMGVPPLANEACETAQQELAHGTTTSFTTCAQRLEMAQQSVGNVARVAALRSLCTTLGGLAQGEEKTWLVAQLARKDLPAADADALKARVDALAAQEAAAIKTGFELARAAVAMDQAQPQAQLAVAAYYAARRAPAEATPYLERARAGLSRDDPLLMVISAEVDQANPDTRARAESTLATLVEHNPKDALGRWRLAAWKVHQGAPDAATAVNALLKLDPTHPQGLALAAHLKSLGTAAPVPVPTPPVAVVDAGVPSSAASLAPTPPARPDAGPPTSRSSSDDDKPKVKISFDKLLAQAERTRDRGNAQKAAGMFMKAMEMEPDRAEPHVGLGWCFVESEKFSAAMGEFDRAIQLNPSYAEAYLGLGEVYKFRGDKFNAIKNYQKYLTILPDGPEAAVAKNNISQLKGQ